MEYSIKKEINGKETLVNLNTDDCRKIYDYVQRIYQTEDVELAYGRETQNYNVTKTVKPTLIEQVVNRYNEMYGDENNGSWLDCVENAYYQELKNNHRGILHVIEQNNEHYFYGHYAGIESSSAVRYTKAWSDAQRNKTTISEEFKNMKNSSGENLYLELKPDEAYDIINSFGSKNNIYASIVTVDIDKGKYKYKSLNGQTSYRVDTDDVIKIVNSISPDTTKNIDLEFKSKMEIMLEQTDKYNCAVLVESGLAATKYYLETNLYGLQDAVQGYIESLPQIKDEKAVAFGNEEARLIEMQPNRKFGDNMQMAVCGPFIIIGDNGYGETVSLSGEQQEFYLNKFKKPDKFSNEEIKQALVPSMEFITFDSLGKGKLKI